MRHLYSRRVLRAHLSPLGVGDLAKFRIRAALASAALLLSACEITPENLAIINQALLEASTTYATPTPYQTRGSEVSCVTYLPTGQRFRVYTRIFTGAQLNSATGRYGRYGYDPYSRYAVLYWQDGRVTVIRLDAYGSVQIPSYGVQGTDESGRRWLIGNSTYSCY